jgi:hypothetical protein
VYGSVRAIPGPGKSTSNGTSAANTVPNRPPVASRRDIGIVSVWAAMPPSAPGQKSIVSWTWKLSIGVTVTVPAPPPTPGVTRISTSSHALRVSRSAAVCPGGPPVPTPPARLPAIVVAGLSKFISRPPPAFSIVQTVPAPMASPMDMRRGTPGVTAIAPLLTRAITACTSPSSASAVRWWAVNPAVIEARRLRFWWGRGTAADPLSR